MGTCIQTGRAEIDTDTVDINDIYGNDDELQYPQNVTPDRNNNTNTSKTNTNTPNSPNSPNTPVPKSPDQRPDDINNSNLDLNVPSKHNCPFNNSSASVESLTVDGPMPPLTQIPSYSDMSTSATNTPHKHTSKRNKKSNMPLQPINDDKTTDGNMVMINYDDMDPEIDDELHHTQYSDEALEAIKSSSGSNDNISDETDDFAVMNNGINKSQMQQSNINGKDEYDSDDTKQEHSDDHDTDSTDLETEEEDEDIEPTPLSLMDEQRNNYKVTMDDEKQSLDELAIKPYSCIQSASATQAGTSKGKSKTNQDSFICDDKFGPSGIFQLYGVCDGHGPNGNDVSKYVTDNLPIILNELLTTSLNKSSIKSILKKTFQSIEENLAKAQEEDTLNFDINYSGTTATIGLFAGNKLYVANIGDSRTVLGKVNPMKHKNVPIAIALSTDHDPKNTTEMIRIKKSKSGRILQGDDDDDARIQIELPDLLQDNKFLTISNKSTSNNNKGKRGRHQRTQSQVRKISASVSRSIGDMIAHEYGGLISEPEITIHTLNDDDIFVVFASDGIWQMIENDDVMRVVGTKLNQNKELKIYEDLQKTTTKLVREANISWQDEYEDYTDDITCVIARIGNTE